MIGLNASECRAQSFNISLKINLLRPAFRNQLSFLGQHFWVLSADCSLKNANKTVTSNSVTAGSRHALRTF
jgi:hypothetical protein